MKCLHSQRKLYYIANNEETVFNIQNHRNVKLMEEILWPMIQIYNNIYCNEQT